MQPINNDWHEIISLKAAALQVVVATLLNELPVNRTVQHMLIPSNYHAHCHFGAADVDGKVQNQPSP